MAVEHPGTNETHCSLIIDSSLLIFHRDVLQIGQDGAEGNWGGGRCGRKSCGHCKPAWALGKLQYALLLMVTQGYYVMKRDQFDILFE